MNERIKHLRKDLLSLSQKDFAAALMVSENFIWMVEKGTRVPSERTLNDICEKFHVDSVWLRTGDGDPFQEESRQDLIMRFAAQTVNGSDEFKKAFVSMLAKLEPEDWEALAKIFRKMREEIEKE